MRITNSMIMDSADQNITGVKTQVDKRYTQMNTQKAIDRPSDDPVVAVRSLRLSTQLAKIDQYYSRNIPDAEEWMDVSETALNNMKSLVKDMHTLADQGANGTLTQTDRNTILTQLKSLQEQIYAEGNADYAGRTVFTGYRTDKKLTFTENEKKTSYNIEQNLKVNDLIEDSRYYTPGISVPETPEKLSDTASIVKVRESDYKRIRLGYSAITSVQNDSSSDDTDTGYAESGQMKLEVTGTDPATGDPVDTTIAVTVYKDENDWLQASGGVEKKIDASSAILIRSTGELIFGDQMASDLQSENAMIKIRYNRTGFTDGELRPEYYYNCTDVTDPNKKIRFDKYNSDGSEKTYDIKYTIAANQEMKVNVEACNIFDSSIYRDIENMISTVSRSISAHDKVDKLKSMLDDKRYSGNEDQENIKKWLDAASREVDYCDDDLQKIFNSEISRTEKYDSDITLARTELGCREDQIRMTGKRMSEQKETVQELQSKNDDIDLSTAAIRFTDAYNAYQASITAAGKIGKLSLLNYI
jgi:flagellar hook-associated protein 3 FlgL